MAKWDDFPPVFKKDFSDKFEWYEYFVFALTLAASLGIGVFFGCFGSRNKTNEEFLMAGRSMSILPVTLSLVCSFVSAITLLGNPVEVYLYGAQYTMIALAFIPMTLVLAYLYVPVMFSLQLTSAYQYFEWRFSKKVRFILSIFAVTHLIVYMPITVYGPSLAMDAVAGIDYKVSAAAIFLVCIAYSSLGGLKAVLWTDALQAVIMVGSLFAVIICGMVEIGGFGIMWERAEQSSRTNFFKCLLFNMIGMITVIILCSWIGLMIFAQYYDCDPVNAEIISSEDQLVPLFVMDVLGDYPILPGLLVAGLTCGSLSTVSSALNSLTAIITEDYVKTFRPGLSETTLGLISKAVSTIAGLIAFSFVFVVSEVNKTINISPFSTLMHGSFLGPILATYTLGMFLPWANDIGTLLGIIVSIAISGFVGLGNIIAGRVDGKLPNQRLGWESYGCDFDFTGSDINPNNLTRDDYPHSTIASDAWKHEDYSFAVRIWSSSYIWGPGIGGLSCLIFGSLFSFIVLLFDKKSERKVNKSLLSKPFLRFWKKCFGEEYMKNYVDSESPPYSGGAAGPASKDTLDSKDPTTNLAIPRATLNKDRYGIYYGGVQDSDYGVSPESKISQRNGIYYNGDSY